MKKIFLVGVVTLFMLVSCGGNIADKALSKWEHALDLYEKASTKADFNKAKEALEDAYSLMGTDDF